MADNVAITPGTGATVGADDIAGVLIQRVKTTWGPDGTANDADVATGKPLPVQVRSATGLVPIGEPTDAKSTATDTTSVTGISIWKQISASIQAVATSLAGTLTVAAHAVTNAGTFAVQATTLGGQAPAFGSGAAGATVLRVLNATDDPIIAAINTGVAAAIPAGTNNIGDVDVLTVPADPFGVNADAGSATGSISAKLRFIAATGIPVTGTVTVGSHAVTNAGTFAVQSTLQAGTAAFGKLAANSGVDIGDVDVTSISAGENHLGEVGGKTAVFNITLSTDTSAYASGDLIADTQQMDAFFRKTDGTGIIQSVTVVDGDAQAAAFYIFFNTTSTSMGTENSAPNISDANLAAGAIGPIAVATTDYLTVSGAKVAFKGNLGIPVKAVSGTDDLYVSVLNGTGTPTYTASGIILRIGVLLD